MIKKIAFILLLFILNSSLSYGMQPVYNPIPQPSFDYNMVEKIIEDSYQLGVWGEGEVRKYKNGDNELYLIVENDLYKNFFLVISKENLPAFLELLSKGKETYNEAIKAEKRKGDVKKFDRPSSQLDYEFIYLDKKQDTYVYGSSIVDSYVLFFRDSPRIVLELQVGRAPKFPIYKSGKSTYFYVEFNGAFEDLMNILSKSLNNETAKVNRDSFERISTYEMENLSGFPMKLAVLKNGEGINTKYYIQYGFKYREDTKYQSYLWIKGIKYKLFKQWIQDIFTKYYGLSRTTPTIDNPPADIMVEYPKGMKLGGIIRGIFDVDMQVLEGFPIDEELVRAHISYDTTHRRYEVAIRFGESEFLFFHNVQDLRSFLDAL